MPQLVLLAGGLATRLYPVTKTIPKSMLEVAGKPFIEHQIELLKRKGISEIVICAGYLGEQILNYIDDGSKFGISVKYSFDGDKLLGTGGALRNALPLLDDIFWLMYGDSYLDIDFKPIFEYFNSKQKSGLMTVFRNENNWDNSNVIFSEGKIVNYDKKNRTHDMKYIDYGLALLRREAVKKIPENEVFDLEELYKTLISRNDMLGYEVKERFYEIGSQKGLQETNDYLLQLAGRI